MNLFNEYSGLISVVSLLLSAWAFVKARSAVRLYKSRVNYAKDFSQIERLLEKLKAHHIKFRGSDEVNEEKNLEEFGKETRALCDKLLMASFRDKRSTLRLVRSAEKKISSSLETEGSIDSDTILTIVAELTGDLQEKLDKISDQFS